MVMAVFGLVAFVPACLRLHQLMIIHYDYYAGLAQRNQSRTTTVAASRGTIYDTNMNILACAQSVENLYLAPNELKQAGENVTAISETLGQILDKDPGWIEGKATDRSLRYQQIASNIDEETAAAIRSYINANQISGIHLEPSSQR